MYITNISVSVVAALASSAAVMASPVSLASMTTDMAATPSSQPTMTSTSSEARELSAVETSAVEAVALATTTIETTTVQRSTDKPTASNIDSLPKTTAIEAADATLILDDGVTTLTLEPLSPTATLAAPLAESTGLEDPFFDTEAFAASMQESAADLLDIAENKLDEKTYEKVEDDVDELIDTVTEGSSEFIEAWSLKKLKDLHIPVPRKVLTTASRGMDIVIKCLNMMTKATVHMMGERAYANGNVTIPFYITKPLHYAFRKPMYGLTYIMEKSAYAVQEINLKIRPTHFHKDPLDDPLKGAYGVLTRAYNVLEAGQIFANISINRTGLEWMPRFVEPVMEYAREIVLELDGDIERYPALPPLPEPAPPPEPEFTWPQMPELKDLVHQAEEVEKMFQEAEEKAQHVEEHVKNFGHHHHGPENGPGTGPPPADDSEVADGPDSVRLSKPAQNH